MVLTYSAFVFRFSGGVGWARAYRDNPIHIRKVAESMSVRDIVSLFLLG